MQWMGAFTLPLVGFVAMYYYIISSINYMPVQLGYERI